MTMLTSSQLRAIVSEADRQCPIGSTMTHRSSGTLYRVMDIVLRESDLQPLICYRSLPSGATFARPLSEFLEKFEFHTRAVTT